MKRIEARTFSLLGTIFYKIGRFFVDNHYFTFGSLTLSISIYLNNRATTKFGLLIAQRKEEEENEQ